MRLPEVIRTEKLIPIARGLRLADVRGLAEALQAGGSTVLEITLESDGGVEAIAALSGSGMIVGAGTVMTPRQAEGAIEAGAEFLVSPHLDPYLVEWSIENDIAYMPGIFTPTEVAAVMSMGLSAMKLFPAGAAGPNLVSSLLGPFPAVELVATGGINTDNAGSFIAAGAIAVGVGGWLTDQPEPSVVVERTKALLQVV